MTDYSGQNKGTQAIGDFLSDMRNMQEGVVSEPVVLDESKFDSKEAAALDFLSTISGTRKDNFKDWAKEAGLSVDKMFQNALTLNNKGGQKAAVGFGKDIMMLRTGDPTKPKVKELHANLKKMFGESVEILDESEILDEATKPKLSYGRDTNGNRLVHVHSPEGKFSIQSNGNLPKLHGEHVKLDSKEAHDEVRGHVEAHGTERHKKIVAHLKEEAEVLDESVKLNESAAMAKIKAGEILINAKDGHRIQKVKDKYHVSPVGKADFKKYVTDEDGVKKLVKESQSLDESVGVSLHKAAYNLFDDGLKETDAEEAGKMLKAKAKNGYISMDDLNDIAKHFKLGSGKGMFKEDLDKAVIALVEMSTWGKPVDTKPKPDPENVKHQDKTHTKFTTWTKKNWTVHAKDDKKDIKEDTSFPTEQLPTKLKLGSNVVSIWKHALKNKWYAIATKQNGDTYGWTKQDDSESGIMQQVRAAINESEALDESVQYEILLEYGKFVDGEMHMTKAEYAKVHKDYKGKWEGEGGYKYGVLHNVNGATKTVPVVLIKEENVSEDSSYSPDMATKVFGHNTFVTWKHKSKSEYYGFAYVTKTGQAYKTIETSNNQSTVIKQLRALVSDAPDKVDESIADDVPFNVVLVGLMEKYVAHKEKGGEIIEAFEQLFEGMTTEQRGKLIGEIIVHLKYTASEQKKPFDEGDTFFSLAFKSDDEIKKIARLTGLPMSK